MAPKRKQAELSQESVAPEKRVKLTPPQKVPSTTVVGLNKRTGLAPINFGGPSSESQPSAPSGSKIRSSSAVAPSQASKARRKPAKDKKLGYKVRKLVPPRPFPTVAPSVNATGPRSAHHEGKNRICVTRRTTLGAYMRRCKAIFLEDGYKTLELHACGAAIPHLTILATSLPSILPYGPERLATDWRTGTVNVIDELLPDDEDLDIEYRTRGKSSLSVTFTVDTGDPAPRPQNKAADTASGAGRSTTRGQGGKKRSGRARDRERKRQAKQGVVGQEIGHDTNHHESRMDET